MARDGKGGNQGMNNVFGPFCEGPFRPRKGGGKRALKVKKKETEKGVHFQTGEKKNDFARRKRSYRSQYRGGENTPYRARERNCRRERKGGRNSAVKKKGIRWKSLPLRAREKKTGDGVCPLKGFGSSEGGGRSTGKRLLRSAMSGEKKKNKVGVKEKRRKEPAYPIVTGRQRLSHLAHEKKHDSFSKQDLGIGSFKREKGKAANMFSGGSKFLDLLPVKGKSRRERGISATVQHQGGRDRVRREPFNGEEMTKEISLSSPAGGGEQNVLVLYKLGSKNGETAGSITWEKKRGNRSLKSIYWKRALGHDTGWNTGAEPASKGIKMKGTEA